MIALLAEAADSNSGLIGGMIGAVGSVGFAVWYGWHVTTKTIPAIVSDFRQERLLDRQDRIDDRLAQAAESRAYRDSIERLADAVVSLPCRSEGGFVVHDDHHPVDQSRIDTRKT